MAGRKPKKKHVLNHLRPHILGTTIMPEDGRDMTKSVSSRSSHTTSVFRGKLALLYVIFSFYAVTALTYRLKHIVIFRFPEQKFYRFLLHLASRAPCRHTKSQRFEQCTIRHRWREMWPYVDALNIACTTQCHRYWINSRTNEGNICSLIIILHLNTLFIGQCSFQKPDIQLTETIL